jgi:hypothetical protein
MGEAAIFSLDRVNAFPFYIEVEGWSASSESSSYGIYFSLRPSGVAGECSPAAIE